MFIKLLAVLLFFLLPIPISDTNKASVDSILISKWIDINGKERVVRTKVYDNLSGARQHIYEVMRMKKKYPPR